MSASPEKITRCRTLALAGIVLMGIGSFMSCLAETPHTVMTGNIILTVSLILTAYGFTYWRP